MLLAVLFTGSLVEMPFFLAKPAVKGWHCGQKLCRCADHVHEEKKNEPQAFLLALAALGHAVPLMDSAEAAGASRETPAPQGQDAVLRITGRLDDGGLSRSFSTAFQLPQLPLRDMRFFRPPQAALFF